MLTPATLTLAPPPGFRRRRGGSGFSWRVGGRCRSKRLVEGVRGGAGGPGKYRTVQNYVVNSGTRAVVYTPPPPLDVSPLMAQLVAWLNAKKEMHTVLEAGLAQFQLVHIHPFVDGNGRTSRLLSTLCLYRAGFDFKRLFSISEFYDRDRPAFYAAIQSVRKADMDMTGWLDFFVEGLATQMDEVKERGVRAIKADLMSRKHRLNARQRAVIFHLLERPELDLQAVQEALPQTPRRTLQRDLQQLVAKRVIAATGATHSKRYRLKDKSL